MPLDTFICGSCQETFTDLSDFVNHKQGGCPANPDATVAENSGGLGQATEVIRLQMNESGEITGLITSVPVDEVSVDENVPNGSTFTFLNDVGMEEDFTNSDLDARGQGEESQTLIILNNTGSATADMTVPDLSLLESSSGVDGLSQPMPEVSAKESPLQPETVTGDGRTETITQKKKRGRSKTGEGKAKIIEAVPPSTPKPAVPEKNTEGKLVCPRCQRTFTKERHFNTHKCLANSSYVDITKKEVIKLDSGDEEEGHEMELDSGAHEDDEEEFMAPVEDSLGAEKEEEDEKEMDTEELEEEGLGQKKKKRGKKKRNLSTDIQLHVDKQQTGAQQMKAAVESLENLPIFKNENEKEAFEACVDIDLSTQVDNMFRIHIIEQELNEMSGMVYNTPTMSSLSVYSCNVCEKVFKSLSHIRLHCITHTDIKPFKCSKCSYSTNSKGNLYTHMRKHTGQYYRCKQCDFKSVNKSHLIEHQMTHDNKRSKCLLCQKDYSTLKSLINHIRKYHYDKKGKDYLQTFLQGRGAKGTAVIHQCHVCNRKFKKRIDRDRHLFIHDIKDFPHVQQCELCDYWASRKIYLDKHYYKHRVIYCCAVCDEKFLSTIRLSEHLSSDHSNKGEDGVLAADFLLEECINRSLYLPEPLNTSKDGCKYVNLPEELRALDHSTTIATTTTSTTTTIIASSSSSSQNGITSPTYGVDSFQKSKPSDDMSGEISPPFSKDDQESGFLIEYKDFIHNSKHDMSATDTKNSKSVEDSDLTSGVPENVSIDSDLKRCDSKNTGIEGEDQGNFNQIIDDERDKMSDPGPDSNILSAGAQPPTPSLLTLQNPGSDSDAGEDDPSGVEGLGHSDMTKDGGASEDMAGDGDEAMFASPDEAGDADLKQDEEESRNQDNDPSNEGTEGTIENDTVQDVVESKKAKIEALIQRMGYRQMNIDIFKKMRSTFGSEECEYCGRLFYSKVDYEPHVRTHTGDKPFACANCSFRANTKDQLRRHSEKEHEKIAFQCKECDFLAPTRTRLWNHQLKHLGINGLSCPSCSSKFDGMKQLRAHILNQHQDIDRQTLEKLTGYRHRPLGRMGRTSFTCPHCPRTFIRANSDLQKHIWIHEGIKPFACPICPYACRSKNNLQAHMLRHSTEKPFSCSECGKEYKSKTALRWHVRSHKTGKPFKCDKCPYEATQSSHLKRHMETHDVLKRFICKHCEFSANTLGYMKIHYARHHKGKPFVHEEALDPQNPESETQVFKCLSCGYLFGNLSDLKRHLKIRHQVQMQDITNMDKMQISEVEVVHYDGDANAGSSLTPVSNVAPVQPNPQVSTSELTSPVQGDMNRMPVSTMNLIQQILSMSQGENQVQVVSEDGNPLEISPETIIIQQDGQLLLTGDAGGMVPGSQYVIQYYNPGDPSEGSADLANNVIQPQTTNPENSIQLITSSDQAQGGQFIITPDGHTQILTSEDQAQILASVEDQAQIIEQGGNSGQLIPSEEDGQLIITADSQNDSL